MSELIKMSDDNILYCLQNLAGYESCDIIGDTVEIAVNDDQFGEMSIVRTAQLGVELITKQAEQLKVIRNKLFIIGNSISAMPENNDLSINAFFRKTSEACNEALEATKPADE